MATMIFDGYWIDYSLIDGAIRAFQELVNGEWVATDDDEHDSKLVALAKEIVKVQEKDGHGYSMFLYRLQTQGKLILPGGVVGNG